MAKITRHTTDSEIGGQIYRGALALQTLFESANSFYRPDVSAIKERILSSIDLTQGQTNYFNDVAERVDKAVKIVSFLRRKFGFEFGNQTKDRKGLLSLISDDLGSSYVKIKQNRMSFGLFPSVWLKEHSRSGGFVKRIDQDYLNLSLDSIKSLIDEGALNSFTALSYVVSPKKHFKDSLEHLKSNSTKLLDRIFSETQLDYADLYEQLIERHELKHLFDNIIGNRFDYLFAETSAHLYEVESQTFVIRNGTVYDYQKVERKVQLSKKRIRLLNDFNVPEKVLISENKKLESYENLKNNFEEFQSVYVNYLQKILVERKESVLPTLSFIFPATQASNEKQYFDKVTRNFQLATDYILEKSDSQLTDSMNTYYQRRD